MEKAEKENNTDESDFSENEILDLNSLKPFEFESKTNIRVINRSSSEAASGSCFVKKVFFFAKSPYYKKQPPEVFYEKRCS